MALAQEPRLLLLDEPTQGLSVEETAQAVETLAALLPASRMTVLLVEHDMEVVFRLAHRITVLHRGAVIADGPRNSPAGSRSPERLSWRTCLMLTIENLNAHYGASHVLQGVDIEVPGGTIVSVLGRNGVGKTTTVRAIMGLVPPSSGRVLLDGQDAWKSEFPPFPPPYGGPAFAERRRPAQGRGGRDDCREGSVVLCVCE